MIPRLPPLLSPSLARQRGRYALSGLLVGLGLVAVLTTAAQAQSMAEPQAPTPRASALQGPVVTYWHPHQVQLQYRQQTLTVPQWQLQPVWAQQSLPSLQPSYQRVTAITYRPRLILEPVETSVWRLHWQQQQGQRAIRVWQPQIKPQQIQIWYPHWQTVAPEVR